MKLERKTIFLEVWKRGRRNMTGQEHAFSVAPEVVIQMILSPRLRQKRKIFLQAKMRMKLARSLWLILKSALLVGILILLELPYSETGKRIVVIQIMIVTMEGLFYDCTVLFDFLRVVLAINGEVADIWFLAFFFLLCAYFEIWTCIVFMYLCQQLQPHH